MTLLSSRSHLIGIVKSEAGLDHVGPGNQSLEDFGFLLLMVQKSGGNAPVEVARFSHYRIFYIPGGDRRIWAINSPTPKKVTELQAVDRQGEGVTPLSFLA